MGASGEVRNPRFRMFLFQGFPQAPFSLDSLAARVFHRRWLPSSQMRSPCACLLPEPSQDRVSSSVLPSPVYQQAERALGRGFQGLFPSTSFEAADLSGLEILQGVLRSPHVTFR